MLRTSRLPDSQLGRRLCRFLRDRVRGVLVLWVVHVQDSLFIDSVSSNLLPFDGVAVLHTHAVPSDGELFERLRAQIPWKEHRVFVFGRWVLQPRLTAWFGDAGVPYHYSGNSLQPNSWTPELASIRQVCEGLANSNFNSVLANLYRDGSDSIAWHADDERELGVNPVIASVNLGQERRFDLRHRHTGETVKVLLPHGSVLVMSGPTQHHWLHQVPKSARPMGERINLTFRQIHG